MALPDSSYARERESRSSSANIRSAPQAAPRLQSMHASARIHETTKHINRLRSTLQLTRMSTLLRCILAALKKCCQICKRRMFAIVQACHATAATGRRGDAWGESRRSGHAHNSGRPSQREWRGIGLLQKEHSHTWQRLCVFRTQAWCE